SWMPPRIDGETASPLGRSVDDDLEEAAGARLDAAFHAIDLLEHACGDGVFGGSGSVEDTAMEDDDGVGPAGGEVEVVEDDDDDPAFRGEAAYDAHDADLVVQVERAGRLVEEEETGFANDRLGEAGELTLTAGEAVEGLEGYLDETDAVEDAEGVRTGVFLRSAPEVCAVHVEPAEDGLEDGEADALRQGLRHEADATGAFDER